MREKDLEKLRLNMDSNGYAHFKDDAFKSRSGVCYIPENAEDDSDCFTYYDIEKSVVSWLTREEVQEHINETGDEKSVEEWVELVYEMLEWQFPSTILDEFLN